MLLTIGLNREGMPSIEKEAAKKDIANYAAMLFGYGTITEAGGVYTMQNGSVTIEQSVTFMLCVDSVDADFIRAKLESMADIFKKWYSQECILFEEFGPHGYAWDFI